MFDYRCNLRMRHGKVKKMPSLAGPDDIIGSYDASNGVMSRVHFSYPNRERINSRSELRDQSFLPQN